MKRLWIAGALILCCHAAQARPQVEVNVPPEVFSNNTNSQRVQSCSQCCIYQDENYSEGAVIKTEGVLLQCQRDERAISTNPLVWRRVKP